MQFKWSKGGEFFWSKLRKVRKENKGLKRQEGFLEIDSQLIYKEFNSGKEDPRELREK